MEVRAIEIESCPIFVPLVRPFDQFFHLRTSHLGSLGLMKSFEEKNSCPVVEIPSCGDSISILGLDLLGT